jgi:nicotinamide-nucleotide amidase
MNAVLEPDLHALVAEVATGLLASGRQLVAAESCTGGWIAKTCTDLPGSSRWFRGGVVAYCNELKVALLGVSAGTIASAGAVSEAVVREMAAGALERLGGEVAIAVSGIAGPEGGAPGKPVGTVWLAWAKRCDTGVQVHAVAACFAGDREQVRRMAVHRALVGVLETTSPP